VPLVELLPGERRESIESEIQIIDAEIASTLNKQTDTSLSVGDDSVTQLFAASFSLLGQELSEQYRVLDEKVRSRTAELEQKSNEIAHALNQNEELLLNILPQSIADRMKQEESLIADYFPDSAILFA
jgi:nitrate/nitrite-specific signal transduction histidine kinase